MIVMWTSVMRIMFLVPACYHSAPWQGTEWWDMWTWPPETHPWSWVSLSHIYHRTISNPSHPSDYQPSKNHKTKNFRPRMAIFQSPPLQLYLWPQPQWNPKPMQRWSQQKLWFQKSSHLEKILLEQNRGENISIVRRQCIKVMQKRYQLSSYIDI